MGGGAERGVEDEIMGKRNGMDYVHLACIFPPSFHRLSTVFQPSFRPSLIAWPRLGDEFARGKDVQPMKRHRTKASNSSRAISRPTAKKEARQIMMIMNQLADDYMTPTAHGYSQMESAWNNPNLLTKDPPDLVYRRKVYLLGRIFNAAWNKAATGILSWGLASLVRTIRVHACHVPRGWCKSGVAPDALQCDEATPACSQCTSTKRSCPGYVERFDLVLRDQTQFVQRKEERRREKKNRTAPLHHASTSKVLDSSKSMVLRSEPNLAADCTVPRALGESPEQEAICAFFGNFILVPSHPDSQCGFFEYLHPLYIATRHDSILSLATSAVALTIAGGDPRRKSSFRLGQSLVGMALRGTGLALQDPIKSLQDETLMAVLLLGFYERLSRLHTGADSSAAHDAGATALIQHRRKHNHKSNLSNKLLFAVHTQVVNSQIQSSQGSENESTDLTVLASSLPQNTANRLTTISAKAVDLLGLVRKFSRQPSRVASEKEIHCFLSIALDVNSQLEEWARSVPETWAWESAAGLNCPSDKPRECFVYGKRIDFYADLNMANIWNSYRSTRIMILSVVLNCVPQIGPQIDGNLSHHTIDAMRTTQGLVDDICASVPYHFGTKLCAGTVDEPWFEYPYTSERKFSPEQRRGAAAFAGWFLMEPLKACLDATSLRQGQREWVKDQLMRIGQCYMVRPPAACQGHQLR